MLRGLRLRHHQWLRRRRGRRGSNIPAGHEPEAGAAIFQAILRRRRSDIPADDVLDVVQGEGNSGAAPQPAPGMRRSLQSQSHLSLDTYNYTYPLLKRLP